MDFILSYNNNEEVLTFPVIPTGGVKVTRGQSNTIFDGVNGSMMALGNVGLCSFEISSVFPLHEYPWMRPGAREDGWYYVSTIENARKRRIPFRAILIDNSGGTIFNMPVSVDSFEYGLDEGLDVAYTIQFTEYRFADLSYNTTSASAQETVTAQTESQKQASQGTSPGGTYTKLYSTADATMIAKVMYGEARGIASRMEIACIGWTILNRVDAGYGSIYAVVTAANQFAYRSSNPTTSDYGYDLVALATDVCDRWSRERAGQTSVGRVLPKGYLWYTGDFVAHNYFRNNYKKPYTIWDYSLPNPYDS